MRIVRGVTAFIAGVGLAFLVACASLGLAPAQTFDQKLAYAYGTHAAVLETAAPAVQAGTLSAAEGASVLKLADSARALLDAAKSLESTNPSGASAKLALASAILVQLQDYLNTQLPKPGGAK